MVKVVAPVTTNRLMHFRFMLMAIVFSSIYDAGNSFSGAHVVLIFEQRDYDSISVIFVIHFSVLANGNPVNGYLANSISALDFDLSTVIYG